MCMTENRPWEYNKTLKNSTFLSGGSKTLPIFTYKKILHTRTNTRGTIEPKNWIARRLDWWAFTLAVRAKTKPDELERARRRIRYKQNKILAQWSKLRLGCETKIRNQWWTMQNQTARAARTQHRIQERAEEKRASASSTRGQSPTRGSGTE
jgi:hypothetical protein